jgi:hypothetical protein
MSTCSELYRTVERNSPLFNQGQNFFTQIKAKKLKLFLDLYKNVRG